MPDKNRIQRNLDAKISDVETKIDTVQNEVVGLNGDAMRGTDNAALEANVQGHAAAALTAYDPPTRAEATADKNAIIVEVNANETKIDTMQTEVAGLNGDTMRGTNNAATAAALTTHDAKLDVVNGYVDPKVAGRRQVLEVSVISAANAGDVTLATVTTQPCVIESIIIHADSASQTDLTSASIYGGVAKVITFINPTDGAKANIDAVDEQVWWEGRVRLATGKTIIITLAGTGATAVDLTVTITYYSCADGGYLT